MKRGICRWISHFSNQTLSSLQEIDSNPDNNRLYWRATRNCLMDVESWSQSRMVCVWYHSIKYDKYHRIDDSDIVGINVGALLIAPFSHAFMVRRGGGGGPEALQKLTVPSQMLTMDQSYGTIISLRPTSRFISLFEQPVFLRPIVRSFLKSGRCS